MSDFFHDMFEHTIETRGRLFLRSLGAEYLIRPLGLQLRITRSDIGGFASIPLGTSKATKSLEVGDMKIVEPDPTMVVASDVDGVDSPSNVIVDVDGVGITGNETVEGEEVDIMARSLDTTLSMARDVAIDVKGEERAKRKNTNKKRPCRRAIDKERTLIESNF